MLLSPLALVKTISQFFPDGLFFQPTDEPVIALTIDDVGDASTQKILDAIATHNQKLSPIQSIVKATFFITTSHLKNETDILEKILEQDHEIGNHGIYDRTHADLKPEELAQEIQQAHEHLTQGSQATIKWFRPGRGRYNRAMVKTLSQMAAQAGYYPQFALGSMIPLDTYRITHHPQFTAQYVTQFIFPGSILVLHGGSLLRANQTAIALEQILSYCDRNHYRVVSLSELYERF